MSAKKLLTIIIIIAIIFAGFFIYHNVSMENLKTQIISEQEQKKTLDERINEIKQKLSLKEEENSSLSEQVKSLTVENDTVFDSDEISSKIQEIGELAAMEYCYTNVGTVDDTLQIKNTNINIPLTKKTVVVTMDGIMKIGIDVKDIKVKCDKKYKTITITLPKAKILSNELDENSLRIYDETNGLFNPVTIEDSSKIRNEIKAKSAENAEKNGVFDIALNNAKKMIQCIVESVPGVKGNYKINFSID